MSTVEDILTWARRELGRPYVYGGTSPTGFDCSGLTQWVYGHAGISLPRTANQQYRAAQRVTDPQPGDLAFWLTGGVAHHVGIYVGDGRIIDAPRTGEVVQLRPVWGTPVYGRIDGVQPGIIDKITGAVTAPTRVAGDVVDAVLGSARDLTIELLLLGGGVALIVIGATITGWRPVSRVISEVQ